jgi:hypothetical protein
MENDKLPGDPLKAIYIIKVITLDARRSVLLPRYKCVAPGYASVDKYFEILKSSSLRRRVQPCIFDVEVCIRSTFECDPSKTEI